MISTTWDETPGWSDVSIEPTALFSSFEMSNLDAWEELEHDLTRLQRLKENWDSLGAAAPRQELYLTATRFLRMQRVRDPNAPPARIVVTPTGGFIFEWQDNDAILEAEIDRPGIAEYFMREHSDRPVFWEERLFDESDWNPTWDYPSAVEVSAAA